jgi:hypothetical protein
MGSRISIGIWRLTVPTSRPLSASASSTEAAVFLLDLLDWAVGEQKEVSTVNKHICEICKEHSDKTQSPSSVQLPELGRGNDKIATSPSLKVHLYSCVGRTMTSYHPEQSKNI